MADKRPQPYTQYPISEWVIWIGDISKIRNTSELYFPFLFSKISCEVIWFNFIFENIRDSKIEIEFKLSWNESDISNLYYDEKWKLMWTDNFLKDYDWNITKYPFPVFALILNKTMHVTDAKLEIDGKEDIVIFDQSIDVMMLPTSYPPIKELKDEGDYIFYEKKTTAFYSDLYLNKVYKLIIYSYSWNPEFTPFFPYWKVIYNNIEYQSNSSIEIKINFQIVSPKISKNLPNHIQKTMNRYFEISPTWPELNPAFKNRWNYITFLPDWTYWLPNLLEKNEENFKKLLDLSLDKDHIKNKEFINYETLRFVFELLIYWNKEELEIIVKVTNTAIPIRIYEQIQKLPEYQDVLVDYEIINLWRKKRRLKVITKIIDITEEAKKTYFLHWIWNKNNNKLVIKFNQIPRLKRWILETIVHPEKAVLSCIVYDEDLKEILFEENYNIDILPHDQMLWYIWSATWSISHNIAPMVIAWISPTDKFWLLDSIRAWALKYHPERSFYISNESTLDKIDEVVSAIYKYLNDDIWINYVNQPFTSNNPINTQRILTPSNVLKNKVGNCIDLTITFASILEWFWLSSLIFVTPNHAFIWWWNKRKTNEMIFLETTFLWRYSYLDAKESWKDTFKKEFLFEGSYNPMPNSLTLEWKGCQIIDLKEERWKWIYAIN